MTVSSLDLTKSTFLSIRSLAWLFGTAENFRPGSKEQCGERRAIRPIRRYHLQHSHVRGRKLDSGGGGHGVHRQGDSDAAAAAASVLLSGDCDLLADSRALGCVSVAPRFNFQILRYSEEIFLQLVLIHTTNWL